MKEGEPKEPSLFDQMNDYLRKEAPKDIEDPTVEGIARRLDIPEDTLKMWLRQDAEFRREMTNLKDFQVNDPFREGTEFDYFIHSSGIQFILDETKKRYTV